MENSGLFKLKTLKNKAAIFQRIIVGVQEAIEKNQDTHVIPDLEFLGTKMTCQLHKKDWVYSLNKARLFFEDIEDYDQCKVCRDLIKKINETCEASAETN